ICDIEPARRITGYQDNKNDDERYGALSGFRCVHSSVRHFRSLTFIRQLSRQASLRVQTEYRTPICFAPPDCWPYYGRNVPCEAMEMKNRGISVHYQWKSAFTKSLWILS